MTTFPRGRGVSTRNVLLAGSIVDGKGRQNKRESQKSIEKDSMKEVL